MTDGEAPGPGTEQGPAGGREGSAEERPPPGWGSHDPEEIARFEALAARWWDPESEFKPLHDINPLRVDYIDRHSPVRGCTVVDVGCGGGLLAEALASRGAEVLGIDLGEKPLQVARLHAAGSGLPVCYRRISAEALAAARPGSFDIVTCLELLEHVPAPESTIAACARLAKPGGMVYFSTINRNPRAWLFAIVGAERVLRLLPRGTHQYARFIRPAELDRAAREAGLELQGLIGMTYNPLTRRYRLEPDTRVNYIARYRRPEE